jgi:hypothetical protein
MMCERSTESHGPESSMSSAADSHVKTSALPERAQESTASDPGYGAKWPESLAKFDPATSLWRTRQLSFIEDSGECLATFPKWGMTRSGELFRLDPVVDQWNESGFGLPAPTRSMGKKGWGISKTGRRRYSKELQENARIFGYKPHPSLLEWAMGWIPMWTRLVPLGTDKFRQWRSLHGGFLKGLNP